MIAKFYMNKSAEWLEAVSKVANKDIECDNNEQTFTAKTAEAEAELEEIIAGMDYFYEAIETSAS